MQQEKIKDFILLIPYYNGYDDLLKSLKSVAYTPENFEILIIDDGSSTPLDLETLQTNIPGVTMQIIRLSENMGIVKALNTGLKSLHSRSDFKYIARLDCGDICHPDRFYEQVKFLHENTEISLLGTWCRFKDIRTERSYLYKSKVQHVEILKEMNFKCSFIHPTVLFRRGLLDTVGYYPEDYLHAEDYAYFWKILKNYKGAILPKEYVVIEFSKNNLSSKSYKKQLISRIKVVNAYGNRWYKYFSVLLLCCKLLLPKFVITWLKYRP